MLLLSLRKIDQTVQKINAAIVMNDKGVGLGQLHQSLYNRIMKMIRAGDRDYELFCVTGEVLKYEKLVPDNCYRGVNKYAYKGNQFHDPIMVTVKSMSANHLFLMDDNNTVHELNLSGFMIECKTGQRLGIVWAIQNGFYTGPNIAVKNLESNAVFFDLDILKLMFRPSMFLISIPGVVLFPLGVYIVGWLGAIGVCGLVMIFGYIFKYHKAISDLRKFKNNFNFDNLLANNK